MPDSIKWKYVPSDDWVEVTVDGEAHATSPFAFTGGSRKAKCSLYVLGLVRGLAVDSAGSDGTDVTVPDEVVRMEALTYMSEDEYEETFSLLVERCRTVEDVAGTKTAVRADGGDVS